MYPRVSALAMLDHLAVLKGVAARGERRETVEALLQQVNLWDVRKKAVAGFSGGMRQRFGIAQALIGNPQLIIVDEPTAGLDPEERNRFNNLLAEIGESRVVILSTHIVDDVTDLCSRMAIMVAGRIVAHEHAGRADRARSRAASAACAVDKAELPALHRQLQIISTRLRAGRTRSTCCPTCAPDPGFEPVDGQPGGPVLRHAAPRARAARRGTRGRRGLRSQRDAATHRRLRGALPDRAPLFCDRLRCSSSCSPSARSPPTRSRSAAAAT